jgi:hypothetical protein
MAVSTKKCDSFTISFNDALPHYIVNLNMGTEFDSITLTSEAGKLQLLRTDKDPLLYTN